MGKGSGSADSRSALVLNVGGQASPAPSTDGDGFPPGTPGKSARAKHIYTLLQQAGGFPREYLLRDIYQPKRLVPDDKVDGPNLLHNAFMHWAPSSYPGHPGYVPEHEPRRRELFYALLLEGDRRANHTFFWRDKEIGGEWTLAAGAAVRGWYQFPVDEQGNIIPEHVEETVRRQIDSGLPLFVDSLRQQPSQTLASCCWEPPEPGCDRKSLLRRLSAEQLSAPAARALETAITAKAEEGKASFALQALRLRDALELADAEQLEAAEREVLLLAAAFSSPFGQAPLSQDQLYQRIGDFQLADQVAGLLADCAPRPADGDPHLPVLAPKTRLGKTLADVQQSWMASRWCDAAAELQRQATGAADEADWLERTRHLCVRSGWHTKAGRERFAFAAKRQEARLRSLIGLYHGIKTPKAPKSSEMPRLKPASG